MLVIAFCDSQWLPHERQCDVALVNEILCILICAFRARVVKQVKTKEEFSFLGIRFESLQNKLSFFYLFFVKD